MFIQLYSKYKLLNLYNVPPLSVSRADHLVDNQLMDSFLEKEERAERYQEPENQGFCCELLPPIHVKSYNSQNLISMSA